MASHIPLAAALAACALGLAVATSASVAVTAWASSGATPNPKSDAPKPAAKLEPGLVAELERVQKEAGKRKAFTVTFEQEFFSSLRKRTRPSSGTLSYLAPGAFRWEVDKPRKELYVNNGKEFWKYSEATRHAQKLPASSVELDFVDLVLKLDSLTERYVVSPWTAEVGQEKNASSSVGTAEDAPPPAASGTLLLTLIPKSEGSQERIHLRVDARAAEVRELRIAYRNGNRTRLVFAPLKEANVEAARFDFTPPPGTAVDKME